MISVARTAPALGSAAHDRGQQSIDAARSLARSVAKGMAAAIPLMVASSMALIAIAIGGRHPDWASWLGMAAGIGVLAGVFVGMWVGFVASAHAFDEADLPSPAHLANARHELVGRARRGR